MGVLDKFATVVEVRLSRAFGKLGWWVAERPFLTIALCLVLAGVLGSGIPSIKSESAPEKLYAPSGNRGQKDLDKTQALFAGASPAERENFIIVYSEAKHNLYTAETLNGIYEMMNELAAIEVEESGETYSWKDLCIKSDQKGFEDSCTFTGVQDLMNGPVDASSLPVIKPDITPTRQGGFEVTALFAGGRKPNADNTAVTYVEAWKIQLHMNAGDSWRKLSSALSRAVFEHLEAKSATLLPEDSFQIAYQMHFSQSEELDKSTSGDITLLSITFMLVIAFSFLVVRSYSDFVLSKGNVVWGAQLGIVLAIASAFGLMGHAGVRFNPVVSTTAFLLLGLGVDDAYVMIQAYHNTARYLGPEATVQERIARTFETAGVSIFFTSVTDTLAFLVGATSVFPAVREFCTYTATGVAFDFLFQVLLFGAVMAVDAHREYCNKKEWAACCGHGWLHSERYNPKKTLLNEDGEGPPGGKIPVMPEVAFLSRTMKAYGERLLSPGLSVVVVVIFAGYLAFAIIGVLRVGTGLDLRDLAPNDSYWQVYVNQNFEYFMEKGPPIELVFPSLALDWSVPAERAKGMALLEELEALDCLFVEPRGVFLREFYASAPLLATENITIPPEFNVPAGWTVPTGDFAALEGDEFYGTLGLWLLSEAGFQFQKDVLFQQDYKTGAFSIEGSRMWVRMEPLSTTSGDVEGVPCMKNMREIVDAWAEENGMEPEEEDAPYVTLVFFRFWESSAVIVEQTALNMLYAAVCCFVVTLMILPHPALCVMAMVVVASILAGVVASMALILNIRIETISMIDLVMSIGFSIDNVAHFCHAYMISREQSAKEKAIDALQVIGIPILLGDASTMIALLPLLGSKSRIFRSFFYILFTVLLLGALHAVVLLPVVLGYLGPLPHYGDGPHSEPSQANGHKLEAGEGGNSDQREEKDPQADQPGVVSQASSSQPAQVGITPSQWPQNPTPMLGTPQPSPYPVHYGPGQATTIDFVPPPQGAPMS